MLVERGMVFAEYRTCTTYCRAYRNARDLCAARPGNEPVPLADGESAGRLAEIAASELAILDRKE